MLSQVTLRDFRDADGPRHLWARMTPEGDVVIEGQDLGDGVEKVFGAGIREYEWVWTVRAPHVPALLAALGAGDDVLAALRARFSDERASGLRPFLDQHGIPVDAWSRVGD
jgi:hypothetical protein